MMKFLPRAQITSFTFFAALLLVFAITWHGCEREQFDLQNQDLEVMSIDLPEVQEVIRIQNQHTADLMSIPGVVGTATGLNDAGKLAILALLVDQSVASKLPNSLDGIPVHPYVTGEINELKGPPGGGNDGGSSFDPTGEYRPAPNGVSIGHPDITAGTLGCLVTKGGNTYILSNNHVMANENLASIGDDIYQPGPFDGGTAADVIGTLTEFVPMTFDGSGNTVDAAIALVNASNVTGATDPAAGSYGAPNVTTVQPALNLGVQKYGRTTEQTSHFITALNANVNVGYDSGTALFVGQFIIEKSSRDVRRTGSFSAGGDSGSLIVSSSADPVGLLFAGSSTVTVGNPIDDVLSAFQVTIVGNGGN